MDIFRELVLLLSAPLLFGGVIAVWAMLAARYARRTIAGAPRLPLWIPWVLGAVVMVGGYVAAAGQLIAGSAFDAEADRQATAMMALLVSPVWSLLAVLGTFGLVLHYVLDGLLGGARLRPAVQEGLARGLRLAYALVGMLAAFFGLRQSYRLGDHVGLMGGDLLDVLGGQSWLQPALNILAAVLALLGLLLVLWVEQPGSDAPLSPSSPPPPPPARPNASD